MPRLPLFQSLDVLSHADDVDFATQANRDIETLVFGHQAEQDIQALSALPALAVGRPGTSPAGQEPSSIAQPAAPTSSLPIVTSARPEIAPLQTQQAQASETPDGGQPAWTNQSATSPVGYPVPTPAESPSIPSPVSSSGVSTDFSRTDVPPDRSSTSPTSAGATPAAMPTGQPTAGQSQDLRSYTRQKAQSLGINPDVAERVAMTEGGFDDPVRQNMQGAPAYGPYQLYVGGPGRSGLGDEALARGIDPRNPAHARAAVDFALEHAAKNGWGAFQGAAAHGIGQWEGIGQSANTPAGQANQRILPQPEQSPNGTPITAPARSAAPAEDIAQAALDDPNKWALCGPVAAVIAAQTRGQNWTVADAKKLAVSKNLWDPDLGMHGLESQAALLRQMGLSARTGAANQEQLAADAQAGNTPIISTNKHYFILKGYDPATGRFDTSTSGTALSGGSRWLTLDQIASLGNGIQGAAYLDNPATPAPSVVAGQSPSTGESSALSQGGGISTSPDLSTSNGPSGTGSTQMMYRQPLGQPTPGDAYPGLNDASAVPSDASAPVAPVSAPPPSAGAGAFQDTQMSVADPVLTPGSAPISASVAGGGAAPPAAQTIPNEDATSYPLPDYRTPASPLVTAPDPTIPDKNQQNLTLSDSSPSTSPLKPVWDAVGNVVGYVHSGAPVTPDQAQDEWTRGTGMRPEELKPGGLPAAIGSTATGIAQATGKAIVDEATAPPSFSTSALPSLRGLQDVQNITGAPGTVIGRRLGEALGLTDDPLLDVSGVKVSALDVAGFIGQNVLDPTNLISGEAPAASRAMREGQQALERAQPGIVQRIMQGVREHLAANAERTAALDAERAGQAGVSAPGVFGVAPPEAGPAVEAVARPRFVPPEERMRLGTPREIPDDPRLQQAVESVGGQITDRGIELHVTRAQGPQAAGELATRGGVFMEAVPEGGRSNFVTSADNPKAVGGTVALPATPTLYRKPIVLDSEPGGAKGFDQAVQRMGLTRAATPEDIANARTDIRLARQQIADAPYAQRPEVAQRSGQAWLQEAESRLAQYERGEPIPITDDAVSQALTAARAAGPEGSPARAQALKDLVSRYGGDPSLIDPLLKIRGADAAESAWAIKENIVAANARKAGYDGVFTLKEPEPPGWNTINQHPLVVKAGEDLKAARNTLDEATETHLATPDRSAWRDYQQADRTYRAAADAYVAAQQEAERLLSQPKISEIFDVQQGRNPTPGASNPRRERLQAERDRLASEQHQVEGEFSRAVQATVYPRPGVDPDVARAHLNDVRSRRNALIDAVERADEALRTEPSSVGQPGYSLHPDVVPPSQGAAAMAGITPVPVRDSQDVAASLGAALTEKPPPGPQAPVSAVGAPSARPRLAPEDRFVPPARPQYLEDRALAAGRALSAEALNAAGGAFAGNVMGGTGPFSQDQNPEDIARNTALGIAGAVALRHGRGLTRVAGRETATEGALATLGAVPPPANLPPRVQAAVTQGQAQQARTGLHPLTWLRRLAGETGNASMLGVQALTTNLFNNLLEPVWATPKEFTRAALPRAMGGRGNLDEWSAWMTGGVHGLTNVIDALIDVLKARGKYAVIPGHEPLSQVTNNPLGRALANAVELGTRVAAGAPDAIFGEVARGQREYQRAAQIVTDAVRAGHLQQSDWRQAWAALISDAENVKAGQLPQFGSTQDVIDAGAAFAKRQTQQAELGDYGKNVKDFATGAIIPDGKGGRKPIPVLGNLITPYFNSPWNASLRLGERTPGVGALMNTQKGFDKVYDQAMGSALVLGVAGLAAQGVTTGKGPSDPEKRKEMLSQGWRPYSSLVNGVYVPNRVVWGVAAPMANMAGDVHDAVAYRKPGTAIVGPEVGADMLGRFGSQLKQQPYLQGVSDALSLLDPTQPMGSKLAQYAASTATRMVPYASTIRAVRTSQDPMERTVDRGKNVDFGTQVSQRIQMALGMRSDLPVAQDVLGRPQANPQQGWGALFAKTSPEKADAMIQTFLDNGVDLGQPPSTVSYTPRGGRGKGVETAPVPLTPAEQRKWNTYRGETISSEMARTLNSSYWQRAGREDKQAELQAIVAAANKDASSRVIDEMGRDYDRRLEESIVEQRAQRGLPAGR
jgi:hypothetical protein